MFFALSERTKVNNTSGIPRGKNSLAVYLGSLIMIQESLRILSSFPKQIQEYLLCNVITRIISHESIPLRRVMMQ